MVNLLFIDIMNCQDLNEGFIISEKNSCHEMEFHGGSFFTDCPNINLGFELVIELRSIFNESEIEKMSLVQD